MPTRTLAFRVDPHPSWSGHSASADENQRARAEHDFQRELYASFGLELVSYAWAEIDLTSPRIEDIFTRLTELDAAGEARFGAGVLTEALTPEEQGTCEWFVITDTRQFDGHDFSLWDDYPRCRAYKIPASDHVVERQFVSHQFKGLVEEQGLRGVEFLWVEDRGKFRAEPWYQAIPRQAMGHGLDHPWFDRAKEDAYVRERLAERGVDPDEVFHPSRSPAEYPFGHPVAAFAAHAPEFRQGTDGFESRFLRDEWSTGVDLHDRLLGMFTNRDDVALTVQRINPHFLRGAVPDADFAYIWWGPDGPNRDGKIMRARELCVNRRTRDLLVAARLVPAGKFTGVVLCDEPPPGVPDLDTGSPVPPPAYPDDILTGLRAEEAKRLAAFHPDDRPVRRPTLKEALGLLRAAKRERPADFAAGARKPTLEHAGATVARLPTFWVDALKIANGGQFGGGDIVCDVPTLAELAAFHQSALTTRRDADSAYVDDRLYFGVSECGDLYAFDQTGASADDRPVELISHEDYSVERRWEGIADFLDAILTDS